MRTILLLSSFCCASLLQGAVVEKSVYGVALDARDPFVKYKASKRVIKHGEALRKQLQSVIQVKGVVLVSGERVGVFSNGTYKEGQSFEVSIDETKILAKVVQLDVNTISATLEVSGKKYKISK